MVVQGGSRARRLFNDAFGLHPKSISGLEIWNSALDIGSFWQDSARTTPVTASSDPVGAWDDKSGNGRHALQAGAAGLKPTYLTGGLNNCPTLSFDAGDYLTQAAWGTLFTGTDTALTWVVVTQYGTLAGTQSLLSAGRTTTNTPFISMERTASGIRFNRRDDASTNNFSASTTSFDLSPHFIAVTFAGSVTNIYHDGVLTNTDTVDVGAMTLDTGGIGALIRNTIAQQFNGKISEALAYSTVLTAAQIAGLREYYRGLYRF